MIQSRWYWWNWCNDEFCHAHGLAVENGWPPESPLQALLRSMWARQTMLPVNMKVELMQLFLNRELSVFQKTSKHG